MPGMLAAVRRCFERIDDPVAIRAGDDTRWSDVIEDAIT